MTSLDLLETSFHNTATSLKLYFPTGTLLLSHTLLFSQFIVPMPPYRLTDITYIHALLHILHLALWISWSPRLKKKKNVSGDCLFITSCVEVECQNLGIWLPKCFDWFLMCCYAVPRVLLCGCQVAYSMFYTSLSQKFKCISYFVVLR